MISLGFRSPDDAFAINYIRFVVNNLISTWTAVVKAALSFWTIRSELAVQLLHQEEDESPKETASDEVEGGVKAALAPSLSLPPATVFVTKGRFTVCFFEDEYCREGGAFMEEEEGAVEEMEVDGVCDSGEWWYAWKRVLRETSGETGWYRCQDLSVLDGNVVRLWDDIIRVN